MTVQLSSGFGFVAVDSDRVRPKEIRNITSPSTEYDWSKHVTPVTSMSYENIAKQML